MKVGDIVTFDEVFHYMEQVCRGVFTNAIFAEIDNHNFAMFHAVDKDICMILLKTDWAITYSVYKSYDGDWCHSDTDLYRVCAIMPLGEAMASLAMPDGSDLWDPDKSYHWIAKWRTEEKEKKHNG